VNRGSALVLAVVALAFAGLSLLSAQTVIGAFDVLFTGWSGEAGSVGVETLQRRQAVAQGQVAAFLPLVGWSVLGAAVAIVGSLVVIALGRGRAAVASL
jgi:hypothetical protein